MDYKTQINLDTTVANLSQAIFIVNRHAKTAINPKYLYTLKKTALNKMIKEKKAAKVGLHFSRNPKFSQQQSDVLVQCGDYTFHIPATKDDFQTLPHLGHLDQTSRNPKTRMSLNIAKKVLQKYTGVQEQRQNKQAMNRQRPVFKRLGDSFLD